MLHPRTVIPVLLGDHPPGEVVLVTAVLGSSAQRARDAWTHAPRVELTDGAVLVRHEGLTRRLPLTFPQDAR